MATRQRKRIKHKDRNEPDEVQLVMKALADPCRRWLLNDLDSWVGVPIAYLKEEASISRQALHKHLEVLIRAGIVVKSCRGATKLYYLDPRPIRRVFANLARRFKRDQRPLGNLHKYGSPTPWD